MDENNLDFGIKSHKNSLYADFKKRYLEYSKLGWSNRGGTNKASSLDQSPPFAIRLISDKALVRVKKLAPDIYKELKKMSIIFQYIKYAPKKVARLRAQNYLKQSKYNFDKRKRNQKYKGIKVTKKSPTKDSLGLTREMEKFKLNYPKILIRKADSTIDYIKSDWTGYLTTMVKSELDDKAIINQDYFFKNPSTIKSKRKAEVDEKIFRKISKILDQLDSVIESINGGFGLEDGYINSQRAQIIDIANSLTLEGLNKAYQEKLLKGETAELESQMLIEEQELEDWNTNDVNWDNLSSDKEETKTLDGEKEWSDFEEDTSLSSTEIKENKMTKKEKEKDPIEEDWDNF